MRYDGGKTDVEPMFVTRIFPEIGLSRLYCKVQVWRTKTEMFSYFKGEKGFDGSCTYTEIRDYNPGQNDRMQPIFAEMNLSLEKISSRIIVHEVTHAMFCWMKRRKITTKKLETMDTEEECAYAHTRMLDQLLSKLATQGVFIQ